MSWIDDLFGGGREKAGKDMYNEMGNWFGGLSPYISTLMQGQNPISLYNQFASSYQESPEALAMNQVGQKAANQANAASGMLGSGAAQTEAANLAQSVRSNDFENYMNHLFNTRGEFLNNENSLSGMMQKYFEDRAQARGAQDIGRAGGLSNMFGSLFGLGESFWNSDFNPFKGANPNSPNTSWLNPDTNSFLIPAASAAASFL